MLCSLPFRDEKLVNAAFTMTKLPVGSDCGVFMWNNFAPLSFWFRIADRAEFLGFFVPRLVGWAEQ